jgi:hypothetical protein
MDDTPVSSVGEHDDRNILLSDEGEVNVSVHLLSDRKTKCPIGQECAQ